MTDYIQREDDCTAPLTLSSAARVVALVVMLLAIGHALPAAAEKGAATDKSVTKGNVPNEAVAIVRLYEQPVFLPGGVVGARPRMPARVKTDMLLLRSDRVLNAALAQPGIGDLALVKSWQVDGGDAIRTLRDKIEIENPKDTPLIRIALRVPEQDAEPAVHLVNAIVNSYLSEVVAEERERLLQGINNLEMEHRRMEEEIRQRRAAYQALERQVVGDDEHPASQRVRALEEHRKTLGAEIGRVRAEVYRRQLAIHQRQAIENPAKEELAGLQRQQEVTETHLKELVAERKKIDSAIDDLTKVYPEMQQRKDHLKRLEKISNEVGLRLERLMLGLSLQEPAAVVFQLAKLPESAKGNR